MRAVDSLKATHNREMAQIMSNVMVMDERRVSAWVGKNQYLYAN
jgi:hypothetical protein